LMMLKEEDLIVARGGWSYIPGVYYDPDKLDDDGNEKEKGFRLKDTETLYGSDEPFRIAFDTVFKSYVDTLNAKYKIDMEKEISDAEIKLTVKPIKSEIEGLVKEINDVDDKIDKE